MIRVRYRPAEYELLIEGHAGSGELGHDLICASVSALTLALEENLRQMEKSGALRRARCDLKGGRVKARAYPKAGYEAVTGLVMGAFAAGFERLEREYPDFIKNF